MQHTTLKATYNPPCIYNLFSNKLYASSENVEKVVNPPQIPVFQNNILFCGTSSLVLIIPATNPINIAPIIFVTNVRNGNVVFAGIKLIAYLPIAPIAPPNATQKKSILSPPGIGNNNYIVTCTYTNIQLPVGICRLRMGAVKKLLKPTFLPTLRAAKREVFQFRICSYL